MRTCRHTGERESKPPSRQIRHRPYAARTCHAAPPESQSPPCAPRADSRRWGEAELACQQRAQQYQLCIADRRPHAGTRWEAVRHIDAGGTLAPFGQPAIRIELQRVIPVLRRAVLDERTQLEHCAFGDGLPFHLQIAGTTRRLLKGVEYSRITSFRKRIVQESWRSAAHGSPHPSGANSSSMRWRQCGCICIASSRRPSCRARRKWRSAAR